MYKKLFISGVVTSMLMVGVAQGANEFKPKEEIFIQGADLNNNQLVETKEKLGVGNNVTTYKVTNTDVIEYTGTEYDFIHSSALIKPKRFTSGVDVEIETPENITRITREQYMNAAITSGIQDATIKIASVDQVTGEGALTGIYKAYATQGHRLNAQDIQNANQEMNHLARISENHQNKDGYSDEALNEAVAEMKAQIAEAKASHQQLNSTTINQIVNQTLTERGLYQILSDHEIAVVQNIMVNVAESNVVNQDPDAFKKQATELKEMIQSQAGDKLKKLKDLDNEETRNFLQKLWDAIVSIFTKIWNWLISFL
ncbi:TPA: DUF1002 domain-containing protein [Staphylococcus pseudintermedius]|uniref:DUF1002 domain-containing protein n=1 Tax=Staphylococcus pseudintermedius TaxID=283734 RepID=UPI0001FFAFE1|nr:DUF1002 domain-containing protein [Staphylococcus pseudintermedius]ADX77663.1 conserved hypothetical protein [Staphylococcus pseudintermedius ED99]EGQ0300949.1 DUF1002 domain-containing protein [Staphylococcus pseudintermedius]EGQ0309760.1 DUF1002 domain-containing protein [Staphylococcus pseudintermedius]EGQ0314061.1 DUF1002 domain-containing protein [Staphylococcus pseudintermedius]EGQ1278978.1 DUF1002 domain-containing protein [Staphylococcus pseudintermedius]